MMDEPIELLCPECGEVITIKDIRLFLLGLHERVCGSLEVVNSVPE